MCIRDRRGGNWEYPHSNSFDGSPCAAVLVADYLPATKISGAFPGDRRKNAAHNFYHAKCFIRNQININLGFFQSFNPIHSTDTSEEALWCIDRIHSPSRLARIYSDLDKIRKYLRNPYPVIRSINYGRRSRVDLISYKNKLAIKKTFRPAHESAYLSELFAYKVLSRSISYIPALLDTGDMYLIVEYIHPSVKSSRFLDPVHYHNRRYHIMDFLYKLWDCGYAHLNFNPNNVMLTGDSIAVIDFEFLHCYDQKPASIYDSYDVVGPPLSFAGRLPIHHMTRSHRFSDEWPFINFQATMSEYLQLMSQCGSLDAVLGLRSSSDGAQ